MSDKLFEYEDKLYKAAIEIIKYADDECEAEINYQNLRDRGDLILASCEEHHFDKYKTQQEIKRDAKNDPIYKTYLDGLSTARAEYLKTKALHRATKQKIQALRTLISLQKSLLDIK